MTDWQPIETWDKAAQEKRQSTIFPLAIVSDGESVTFATDWGVPEGWRDEQQQDYDGPLALAFAPTHWMPLPNPPGAAAAAPEPSEAAQA